MVHYPAHLDADSVDSDNDDDECEQSHLLLGGEGPNGSSLPASSSGRALNGSAAAPSKLKSTSWRNKTFIRGAICALSLALGLASGARYRRKQLATSREAEAAEILPPELSYLQEHASWHPIQSRSLRFPSPDDRVRLYMSNWYVPPCRGDRRSSRTGSASAQDQDQDATLVPRQFLSGLLWYKWKYASLSVLRERDEYDPNATLIPELTFNIPLHSAATDVCDNVHLSGDVATPTDKSYLKHNLYVLDWHPVKDCSEMKRNHHAPYCRDSLDMIAMMDELEGRTNGENTILMDVLGEPDKMVNSRTPIIVRYGDTLGVFCDLPIFGKTRGAALTVAAAAAKARARQEQDEALNEQEQGPVEETSTTTDSDGNGRVVVAVAADALEAVIAASATSLSASSTTTTTTTADTAAQASGACYVPNHHLPRPALKTTNRTFYSYSPIIWNFHSSRSNEMLRDILESDYDTPWTDKRPVAVWRGALTGAREEFDRSSSDDGMSDEEVCHRLPRCRLVMNHANSDLVDAKLTRVVDVPMPDTLLVGRGSDGSKQHVRLFADGNQKMSYQDQLKAKALIVLEGNDLATGLRWSLLSRSVVLMPPPTRTSWAMEEWLEPWVHYVPLHSNLTNVEERVRWVIDNDEEAQRIAERGTLFAYDLVLHPHAERDDLAIQEEMMRRYREYFVLTPERAVG